LVYGILINSWKYLGKGEFGMTKDRKNWKDEIFERAFGKPRKPAVVSIIGNGFAFSEKQIKKIKRQLRQLAAQGVTQREWLL
jgi:hypothetical protein